jgi:hypothetical protein
MFIWRNTDPTAVGRILVRMAQHRSGRQSGAQVLPLPVRPQRGVRKGS